LHEETSFVVPLMKVATFVPCDVRYIASNCLDLHWPVTKGIFKGQTHLVKNSVHILCLQLILCKYSVGLEVDYSTL